MARACENSTGTGGDQRVSLMAAAQVLAPVGGESLLFPAPWVLHTALARKRTQLRAGQQEPACSQPHSQAGREGAADDPRGCDVKGVTAGLRFKGNGALAQAAAGSRGSFTLDPNTTPRPLPCRAGVGSATPLCG